MTTPTGPPLPSQLVGGGQPAPEPQPAPAPPAPAPPAPPAPAGEPEDAAAELRAALEAERRKHRETQQALAQLQAQGMSDTERAIAEAREAGKAEAIREAGKLVAAAEFRAMVAGRLADPEAYLELLDLSPFIGEDGSIDKRALSKMVDKLLGQLTPPGARIPAGAMGNGEGAEGDFLRQVIARKGRG